MSKLKSTIQSDATFARHHALRSADILHSLLELVVDANSDEDALAALRNKQAAIVRGTDNAFLEEGIINFYLKSVNMNEGK